MNQQLLELALAEFVPPPDDKARMHIAKELEALAHFYRALAEERLPGPPPSRRMLELADGSFRLETDEEMAAFREAWKNRTRPGRPMEFAGRLLVVKLRGLLEQSGCHYGAPKDSENAHHHLANLASLVHRMSGLEEAPPSWQSLAERASDEFFRLETLLGEGLVLPPCSEPEARKKALAAYREVLRGARVSFPKSKISQTRKLRHRANR